MNNNDRSEITQRIGIVTLSPGEVAACLGISRSTVIRMILAGSLPAVCLRRGKRKAVYRVRKEMLEDWIMSQEKETAKKIGQGSYSTKT